MVIIQNAFYLFGDLILNQMFEEVFTEIMRYYQLSFKLKTRSFFPGQNGRDNFSIDLRVVPPIDPEIGKGYIDLFMLGNMVYKGKQCQTKIKDNNLHFYDSEMSQIVIGESTATCWANTIAASKLFPLSIYSRTFNRMFNVTGYKIDSSSISNHIKLFQEKLGDNRALKFNVWFSDIDI